ncbi:hypothetical protein J6590_081670 [Homalodisca vitripennis]|nr:hypothetical protein J6590_081670 [Homalodisca vitripennis]
MVKDGTDTETEIQPTLPSTDRTQGEYKRGKYPQTLEEQHRSMGSRFPGRILSTVGGKLSNTLSRSLVCV